MMVRTIWVAIGLLLVALVSLSEASTTETVRVLVNNDAAYAYLEKGNEQAKFKELWGWGYSVSTKQIEGGDEWVWIDSPVTFGKPQEFVFREGGLRTIREVKGYWMKRRDLVLASELKKVKEGWPIRYLFYDTGDIRMSVIFSPSGEAKVFTWGPNYEPIWEKGHVFLGESVVEIKYPAPSYESIYTSAGYDAKEQKVYPVDTADGEFFVQGLFSDPRRPIRSPLGQCLLDCK